MSITGTNDARVCEDCKSTMCRMWRGAVLTSNPPQYPLEWHCQCGRVEQAGSVTTMTGSSCGRCDS